MQNSLEEIIGFGILIKKHRKQKGLTQKKLAEVIGVSTSYLTLVETGRRKNLGFRHVKKLVDCFELRGKDRQIFYFYAGYSEGEFEFSSDKGKYPHLFEILISRTEDMDEITFINGLYDALRVVAHATAKTKEEREHYCKKLRLFKYLAFPSYKKGK